MRIRLGYKFAPRKIGALQKSYILGIDNINRVARALFLRHPVRVDVNIAESIEDCPLFTIKELEEAVLTMKKKKIPGLDGVRPEV